MGALRKGGILIRVPLGEYSEESIAKKVGDYLIANKGQAYTRMGLMIEVFGYKPADLNGPYGKWPRGASTLYKKVNKVLNDLIVGGKVARGPVVGNAKSYFWQA